jgi:UDP-glucose 4-epimerase
MKVVVIGGSGFIGSHVCDYLSNAGYEVTIFDMIVSPWLQKNQKMVLGDLMDKNLLIDTINGASIVYNFGAISDLNEAKEKPLESAQVNIIGNIMILEACRLNNVRRFIYASTVYVYSREGGFYKCSKQSAEHYVEEYYRRYGLSYTILRFGSLYGPRSDEKNGLFRIVKNALETGIVRYEGNKESLREYIHVEDAAEVCIKVIEDEFANQSIVLTGQEAMRVENLLKMLAEILGYQPEKTEFIEKIYEGHYIKTPYAYMPKIGRKYIPSLHIDLGQGLLQLIDEVQKKI